MMKFLITGGFGFLGSNLAAGVIRRGHELVIFDNLSRIGGAENLAWLKKLGMQKYEQGDIRNSSDIDRIIQESRPDFVFHLAGQVAMTTSLENPRLDFEINAGGSFNVLDAVRRFCPETPIIYSSTNKVYGDLDYLEYEEREKRYTLPKYPNGLDEAMALEFHSPYGCSKGSADQYMQDFHRAYGLKTVVFRHSSMYGARQHGTFDQGWISWFCKKALESKTGKAIKPFSIAGNGKQVRDVLEVRDMDALYFQAVKHINYAAGHAFNIGGGISNSLSLLELFDLLEELVGTKLFYEKLSPRFSDQKVFVADISKATRLLDWKPTIGTRQGIAEMVQWLSKETVT